MMVMSPARTAMMVSRITCTLEMQCHAHCFLSLADECLRILSGAMGGRGLVESPEGKGRGQRSCVPLPLISLTSDSNV